MDLLGELVKESVFLNILQKNCFLLENTKKDLCVRWHQAGAYLYTFYRNHNFKYSAEQNPTVFTQDGQRKITNSIFARYQLSPYMYSLLYKSQFGEMVIRPVTFEFDFEGIRYLIYSKVLFNFPK